jgi:hypothetical protein
MAKRTRQSRQPEQVASSGRRERPDVVHTSLYVPKAAYQALREIAFHEDRKIHDLVIEGLNSVLAKRSYASISKLKTRK